MSRLKDILKQIREDKIIAKEDEGGAIGGEVSAPTGATTPSGDVSSPSSSPKSDGSLSTTDIMGRCDHKKDGFFGPGCMHLPFPVFTSVPSRIKKKKRKYIKVLDLMESDDFEYFEGNANRFISRVIKEINNNILSKINPDLKVVYDKDYDFSGDRENWVAALNKDGQTDINEIPVALNLPVIYNFLDENSLEDDQEELYCQIKASVLHEVGHGIIQYFKDKEIYDFELSDDEEEKIVEEYAKYHMRRYTGVEKSTLQTFIDEIFKNSELVESNSIIRGDTSSTLININHPMRKVSNIDDIEDYGDALDCLSNIEVKKDENIFDWMDSDVIISISSGGYVRMHAKDTAPEEDKHFKATVDDILKLVHNKVKTLPIKLLIKVDSRENGMDYRHDEDYDELICKDIIQENKSDSERLCRMILSNDRIKDRKDSLNHLCKMTGDDFKNYDGIGDTVFVFQTPSGCDHVTSKGLVICNGTDDSYNKTIRFDGPTDIIHRLRKQDSAILYGNENAKNVPVELLWNCLENALCGRAYTN